MRNLVFWYVNLMWCNIECIQSAKIFQMGLVAQLIYCHLSYVQIIYRQIKLIQRDCEHQSSRFLELPILKAQQKYANLLLLLLPNIVCRCRSMTNTFFLH